MADWVAVRLRRVAVARGGTRGDAIKTSANGRVFISQSHQIDVLQPVTAPHVLSTRELLRPPVCHESPRHLEPFTRAWYEELELKRYLRQGAWLPRWRVRPGVAAAQWWFPAIARQRWAR